MAQNARRPILTFRNNAGREKIDNAMQAFPRDSYVSHYLAFGDHPSLEALFNSHADIESLVDFGHSDYESLVASADEDAVTRYFEENVSFRACILKRAGRSMLKRRRGRLIYVSSTAATGPNPGQGFYAAAKLASEALYRSMGLELGAKGITAAILRPGYVDAGRGAKYLSEKKEAALSKIPISRAIGKEEVAKTILFLLSEEAHGINGSIVTLDGGMMAGK